MALYLLLTTIQKLVNVRRRVVECILVWKWIELSCCRHVEVLIERAHGNRGRWKFADILWMKLRRVTENLVYFISIESVFSCSTTPTPLSNIMYTNIDWPGRNLFFDNYLWWITHVLQIFGNRLGKSTNNKFTRKYWNNKKKNECKFCSRQAEACKSTKPLKNDWMAFAIHYAYKWNRRELL